jgi:hypothetical protein
MTIIEHYCSLIECVKRSSETDETCTSSPCTIGHLPFLLIFLILGSSTHAVCYALLSTTIGSRQHALLGPKYRCSAASTANSR